jgi:16S rRNA (uracil1498-N3)-methyltransferase
MHRFFLLDQPLAVGQPVDLTPLAHQLTAVLRVQPGSEIILLDGQGAAFVTEIYTVARRQLTGLIRAQQRVTAEPQVALTLYQCGLKADKFEWVLQKGTELGVAHFVPVVSERTVVRPAGGLRKKYERWRAILTEAAEQAGRGRIPTLHEPQTWAQAVQSASGLRLLPWEEERALTTGLGAILSAVELPPQQVSLLVGPEGGVSPPEALLAQQAGWQFVSLGPRVLRAETAALAAITIVLERCGELGPR